MGKETGAETGYYSGVAPAFKKFDIGVSVDVGPYTDPNTTAGENLRESNRGYHHGDVQSSCLVCLLKMKKLRRFTRCLCEMASVLRGRRVTYWIRICVWHSKCQRMSSRDDKPWEGVKGFLTSTVASWGHVDIDMTLHT